ncbi:THAP domain-containing protein 1 B-like [Stegodyphus dumicola]|uniref:THAP domain-containing protein 1 B-like n=1 Tax=Stegodyphus dumicola TaxID=202533 RepID=UPI0015A9E225|nr:THAP domain-containing protein 1 B-like [Stegodyphus dumicola]
MVSCAVATCSNTYHNTKTSVVFHRFPCKNIQLTKEWLHRCRRADIVNTKSARICSIHFTESDYEDDMKNRLLGLPTKKILKSTAIPTACIPDLVIYQNTPRQQRQQKKKKLQSAFEMNSEFKS